MRFLFLLKGNEALKIDELSIPCRLFVYGPFQRVIGVSSQMDVEEMEHSVGFSFISKVDVWMRIAESLK